MAKKSNKRCYVCRKCHEVTAMGHVTVDGKKRQMAPAQCAACGSDDLFGQELHEALPEGMHLVKCDGEAHENPHIDHCGVCAPRYGFVVIPKQYATLRDYRMRDGEGGARIIVVR